MAASNITVDTREFERRMKRLTDVALNNARIQASHDAANQTKTKASRLIGQDINLPAAKIKEKLVAKAIRGAKHTYYELRVSYKQIGAQGFAGWKWTDISRRLGMKIVRTSKDQIGSVSRIGKGKGGLVVKFYKKQAPLHFSTAFPMRGGNFFRRVKPSTAKSAKAWSLNMPIERIAGPSVHGAMEDVFPRVVEDGRAAYRRRLSYWIGQETKKI
jgi:hypothetical protein